MKIKERLVLACLYLKVIKVDGADVKTKTLYFSANMWNPLTYLFIIAIKIGMWIKKYLQII
jgi:hypothetical protein